MSTAALQLHVALSLRLDAVEAYRLAHAYRSEVLTNAAPPCAVCETPIEWVACPTGGWWAHRTHPADEHDALPPGVPSRTEVLREAGGLADELIAAVPRTDPDAFPRVDSFRAYSDRLHEIADSGTPARKDTRDGTQPPAGESTQLPPHARVLCAHGYVLGQDSCPGCDAAEEQPHRPDPVHVRTSDGRELELYRTCGQPPMRCPRPTEGEVPRG